jgi:signal transduction histidine kinase/CheY-like chemotaxis protein
MLQIAIKILDHLTREQTIERVRNHFELIIINGDDDTTQISETQLLISDCSEWIIKHNHQALLYIAHHPDELKQAHSLGMSAMYDTLLLPHELEVILEKSKKLINTNNAKGNNSLKTPEIQNLLLDNTYDIVWCIDSAYHLTYCNDEFYEVEKLYNLHEITIDKSVLDGLTEENKNFWQLKYDQVFKGKTLNFDDEVTTNNITIYFENYLFPIFGDDKEVLNVGCISRNITDRKSQYIELQNNKNELDNIIKSIDDIVIEIDTKGLIKNTWSNSIDPVYFEKSAIANKNYKEILPYDSAVAIEKSIEEANAKNVSELIIELNTKQRKIYRIRIRKKVNATERLGFILSIKDITESETLRNATQVIIDNTEDMIWAIDLNKKLIAFNRPFAKACQHFIGLQLYIGFDMILDFNPALANDWLSNYNRCLAGESFEFEYIYFNNPKLISEINMKPILDHNKKVIGATIKSQNNALRKQQERTLIQQKNQLNSIIQSMDEIVVEMDADGNYLNAWSKDNNQLEQYLLNSSGKNIVDLHGIEKSKPILDAIHQALNTKNTVVIEYESLVEKNQYYSSKINEIISENPDINAPRRVSISATNITELYNTKTELAKSQSNLESLINNINESIWSIDTELKLTACNNLFKEKYEFYFKQILNIGDDIKALNPIVISYWMPFFERSLKGERLTKVFKFEINSKNYYFEFSVNPILLNNKIIGIAGSLKDISESKENQKLLLAKDKQLNAIMKSMNDVVLEVNSQLEVSNVWTTNESILPIPINQLVGSAIAKDKFLFGSRYLSKNIIQSLETKSDYEDEFWAKHYGWLRARINYVKNNNSTPSIVVSLTNINELKKTERFVKSQSEQLFTLLQSIQDSIVLVDENYYIQMCNDAFYTLLLEPVNYKKTKILDNLSIIEVLQKSELFDAEEFKMSINNSLIGNKIYLEKTKNINNELLHFGIQFNPVISDGDQAKGVVILFLNITEQKNKALLEKQKSDAINVAKAKSDFLSVMSHEIKTPLNAVIGFTHILLDEEPNASQIEPLSNIKIAANNLLGLIEDILFYNRLDSGKIEIRNTDFNLYQSMKAILAGTKSHQMERNNIMQLEYDIDLPHDVNGDEIRINQIINNLVSNASKFTQNGIIKLSIIKLSQEEDDNIHIRFEVSDNGKGIAKEKQEKIFEFFEQENVEITRKYGGTGIGLAIVKTILSELESKIELTSEVGVGSAFSFNLMLRKSELQKADLDTRAIMESEHKLKGVKILIAEDTASNVWVITKMLRKSEAELIICNNGAEAVACCENQTVDLVLMDIQMPIMDGFEATKRIRKTKPNLPIIALSAANLDELQEQITESGMTDYLSKPFNPQHFFTKIYYYTNRIKAGFFK